MLFPELEVTIGRNHISARDVRSGQTTSVDAPFSCSHLLIEDVDILEHACQEAMKQVAAGRWWSFPRVKVVVAGQAIHHIERKIIIDALRNAGALRVVLESVRGACEEHRSARDAYIERAMRKR